MHKQERGESGRTRELRVARSSCSRQRSGRRQGPKHERVGRRRGSGVLPTRARAVVGCF